MAGRNRESAIPGKHLTPSQGTAVEHFEGPLLVLAGPGSGKTRVITHRIARLVERGVNPREILALTFTNKAARAMAERVESLLPGTRIWVTTFHKFCARVLRDHAGAIGLKPNYTIFDTSDQQQVIRQALHEADIDAVHYSPAKILWRISAAKNEMLSSGDFAASLNERATDHWNGVVARVYPEYQRLLLASNAVDFDDLLLHVSHILQEQTEIRRMLDRRHKFLLVDEYQDTNLPQYKIAAALSHDYPNLCVTGDPDQSIYSWRGARIENILRFKEDYPQAQLVKLEENFRSTPQVLKVADELIAHNRRRQPKQLKPQNADGPPVTFRIYESGAQEAAETVSEIRRLVTQEGWSWSDFAVFYRVNALSRSLEAALTQARVPYQIAAGVAFFERAEVKDLIAYLRLIENPEDQVAFQRVVNNPVRGIGKNSQNKVLRYAAVEGIGLLEAAARGKAISGLPKKAGYSLTLFAEMIENLRLRAAGPVGDLIERILEVSGFAREWMDGSSEEAMQRLGNIRELVNAARNYDEASGDQASLEGFLETTCLTQDSDSVDDGQGTVTLMTLHAAKGLEFRAAYIIALEQNLLPHERSLSDETGAALEEERRLLFVGVTRAKEQLTLSRAVTRDLRGRFQSTIPSQFLDEMTLHVTDYQSRSDSSDYAAWAALGMSHSSVKTPGHQPAASSPLDQQETSHSETSGSGAFGLGKSKKGGRGTPSANPAALLMTGADLARLQRGEKGNAKSVAEFSPGMAVRHPSYGLGKVLSLSDPARLQTVMVEFHKDGEVKTFVASKCPLQPVGLQFE